MRNRWGNSGNSDRLYFLWALKSLQMVTAAMKLKHIAPWKKSYDQHRQHIKTQRHYLPTKFHLVKAMVFPVVMYGCESWTIKKAECWRIMLLNHGVGEALDSPLDCKEIKPGNPKGNQPWIFIGRTDAEAEIPILWPRGEELTPGKRPWCWERLRAGGEGDDRGWDGQMASSTRWTWVWASSGSWWCTGKPGMLQSMESQRVRHDWVTELNWTHVYTDSQVAQ